MGVWWWQRPSGRSVNRKKLVAPGSRCLAHELTIQTTSKSICRSLIGLSGIEPDCQAQYEQVTLDVYLPVQKPPDRQYQHKQGEKDE